MVTAFISNATLIHEARNPNFGLTKPFPDRPISDYLTCPLRGGGDALATMWDGGPRLLRYGIEGMPPGRRRTRLEGWLRDELPSRFEGRLLFIDDAVADGWGKTVARSEMFGRPLGVMDAFIASTANVHSLKLVTRNGSDFESIVEEIVNPWMTSASLHPE
jgi:predicted nucleic acid-binding protein